MSQLIKILTSQNGPSLSMLMCCVLNDEERLQPQLMQALKCKMKRWIHCLLFTSVPEGNKRHPSWAASDHLSTHRLQMILLFFLKEGMKKKETLKPLKSSDRHRCTRPGLQCQPAENPGKLSHVPLCVYLFIFCLFCLVWTLIKQAENKSAA